MPVQERCSEGAGYENTETECDAPRYTADRIPITVKRSDTYENENPADLHTSGYRV